METATPSEIVRSALQLIASKAQQNEYEARVPSVDVTVELVCIWFDDTYDAFKHRLPELFSADELAALVRFQQFFDSNLSKLPDSLGTVKTWHENVVWLEIMNQAESALDEIAV